MEEQRVTPRERQVAALVVDGLSNRLIGEHLGIAENTVKRHVSNLMLVCPSCGKTRVGYKFEGDQKVRVCKKCGETLASKK